MAPLRAVLRRQTEAWRIQSDYWRSLPDRAVLKLLVAVFFMFSTIGVIGHIQLMATTGMSHWARALVPAVLAGGTAAAFVLAFMRDKRYMLLIVLFQIGWIWGLKAASSESAASRTSSDAAWTARLRRCTGP